MSADLERTRAELLALLRPSRPLMAAPDDDVFPRSKLMRTIIHRGRGWALLGLSAVALAAAYRRRSLRALVPLLGLVAGAGQRLLDPPALPHAAARPRVIVPGTVDADGPRRV
jgi:hypothetical protein